MTRIGKIGRLPREVRDALNRRLDDGEEGEQLLEWLNQLPAVKKVLRQQFESRPITKQNLSEWRQGGFQDWLKREEARATVQELRESSSELAAEADALDLSEDLAVRLTVELAQQAKAVLDEPATPTERWDRLTGVMRQLSALRRDTAQACQTRIKYADWKRKRDEEERLAERNRLFDEEWEPIAHLPEFAEYWLRELSHGRDETARLRVEAEMLNKNGADCPLVALRRMVHEAYVNGKPMERILLKWRGKRSKENPDAKPDALPAPQAANGQITPQTVGAAPASLGEGKGHAHAA